MPGGGPKSRSWGGAWAGAGAGAGPGPVLGLGLRLGLGGAQVSKFKQVSSVYMGNPNGDTDRQTRLKILPSTTTLGAAITIGKWRHKRKLGSWTVRLNTTTNLIQ